MIRIALLAIALILSACRFQIEDEADEPPPAHATQIQDPRCPPGGVWTWFPTGWACSFEDKRPPGAPE